MASFSSSFFLNLALCLHILACKWFILTITVGVGTVDRLSFGKDYVGVIVAMSWLPAEVIYWTNSKTLDEYESFGHHNMYI